MPLTPTHVLAVVPVAAVLGETLPFSALAIGSMIPDLPLFLPYVPGYQVTHSFRGLFTACLPLGFLVFVVFQVVLKRPLLALLPREVQDHCAGVARDWPWWSFRRAAGVAVAVVVGALTHVVWDAFTHQGRFGTALVPWLNATVLTFAGRPVAGYQAAQYGCTFVGLPLLGWLALAWLRRQEPQPADGLPSLTPAVKTAVVLAVVLVPALVSLAAWGRADLSRYERLGMAVTRSGYYLIVAVMVYGAAAQVLAPRSGGADAA